MGSRRPFAGQINKGLEGLYLTADGPEQLLCTQCEATYARTISPASTNHAHLNGQAQKSYARALETMDQAAEFKARTRAELIGWFIQSGG